MVRDEVRRDHSADTPTPAADPDQRVDPSPSAGDVTQILSPIEQGDGQAAEQLLPLVYDELRKLAAAKMAQEKPGQTLQATALVHEAYIRLVDVEQGPALGQSRPFLCGRCRGHAADSGGQCPRQSSSVKRRRRSRRELTLRDRR